MVGPSGKQSFYRVLSAAIADFSEHGFDSQERLERWLREIEQAARATLIPESVLQRELQQLLTRVYERATQDGRLVRAHPGISQFTLQQVKPKLRAELNRRILASANLIKLNREASIQHTLQRFAGWASSVPIGGSNATDTQETRANVRRAIAGLSFVERRVVIDQGMKLANAVNELVAQDGGAIAARWKHVREGGGYQARPEHEKRDGELFVLRDNWALRAGLMRLNGHAYTDDAEQPAELVYCRCSWSWVYNLRDLPPDMLTNHGRAELSRVREQLARM